MIGSPGSRAAQTVDPLIAGNRKHPSRRAGFSGIEIGRFSPYRYHDLLGHFLRSGIFKARSHQEAFDARREIPEKSREGVPVLLPRDCVDETDQFLSRRQHLFLPCLVQNNQPRCRTDLPRIPGSTI